MVLFLLGTGVIVANLVFIGEQAASGQGRFPVWGILAGVGLWIAALVKYLESRRIEKSRLPAAALFAILASMAAIVGTTMYTKSLVDNDGFRAGTCVTATGYAVGCDRSSEVSGRVAWMASSEAEARSKAAQCTGRIGQTNSGKYMCIEPVNK